MDKEFESVKKKEQLQSKKGNQFAFDVWYAEAWSRRQGYLSFKIANNLKKKFEAENKTINSVLDVCSGSGEFLGFMHTFVPVCVGVDNADGYLAFVKSKFKDIDFKKVALLNQFKLDQKFDLITCNHDVVNMFLKFDEWTAFFKTAMKHLVTGGLFVFDFYTKKHMDEWNAVTYEQDFTLDYVEKVEHEGNNCVMDEVYYIRESESLYRKTADKMIETGFETKMILDALAGAGFKDIHCTDIDFNELTDVDNVERVHIICQK